MGEDLPMIEQSPLCWWSDDGRYTVTITQPCLQRMVETVRAHHPKETGSSLIGCYSEDGFDACVVDIAPITVDSQGTRSSFRRGVAGLRRFFEGLRQAHGGRRFYVGEWHSHPGGSPEASSQDDHTQTRIASDRRTQCPESILIIIGGKRPQNAELAVYIYSRGRGRIVLTPCPAE